MWKIGGVALLLVCFPLLLVCQSLTQPQQLHITFANVSTHTGDNSIAVTWVTSITTDSSAVRYGTASGQYTSQVGGIIHTYTQGNWHGFIHDVILDNLAADTRYYYVAGDYAGGWSAEHSFVTKPPSTSTINVLAIGDMSTTLDTQSVLNATIKEQYTLALIAGDLSYANGNNKSWDVYFNLIAPQAANNFWMTAIGNHEAEKSDFYGVPYLSRHVLPNNELWYGFDYGPLHVLAFSTEHATNSSTDQYKYIEQDLKKANANRDTVPFIVTFAHKPIYTSNADHSSELVVRTNIEPLLIRYGVDIAIWGHNHCYERTYPITFANTNNTRTGSLAQPYNTVQAPVHVTVGTGGKELYSEWVEPQPAWSFFRLAAYGYSKFSVNTTQLHWQYFTTDGAIADEFYIIRPTPAAGNNIHPAWACVLLVQFILVML